MDYLNPIRLTGLSFQPPAKRPHEELLDSANGLELQGLLA